MYFTISNIIRRIIQKNSDKVAWKLISSYQTLSEEFMQKNNDKVGWENISRSQKLSDNFIQKNIKTLKNYRNEILNNKKININKKICDVLHIDYQIKFTLQSINKYKDILFPFTLFPLAPLGKKS